jgi:hypothetical protein
MVGSLLLHPSIPLSVWGENDGGFHIGKEISDRIDADHH